MKIKTNDIWIAGIIILLLILAAVPVMSQTVVPKTPPTPLQVCENNRDHFRSELETALNSIKQLSELNDQLVARIMSLKEQGSLVPVPRAKPEPVTPADPKTCPPKTGRDKCKEGRTASPDHNCQCGRWN